MNRNGGRRCPLRWRLLISAAVLTAAGCGPVLVWEGGTPCRQQRIRVVEQEGRQRVLVGGRAGAWYEGVSVDELAVSADRSHLAYPARIGTQWTVVLDGHERGRWDGIGELSFAPDGRLAFSAERDGRWYVVDDGKSGPAFAAIFARTLRWSANGRALVYAGTRNGFAEVVWNGTIGPAFDGIARIHLGRLGTRLLYAGRRADGWHVVDGQHVGSAYEAIVDMALSSDGRHAAYVWRNGSEQGVVVDGAPLPAFRDGLVSDLSVDEDGRLTFVASRADGACVVRRSMPQPLYARIRKLVVTDAGHYAYVAEEANRVHVIIDGRDRGSADAVEDIAPAPDGQRFLRVLRRGQRWIVADDEHEAAFDQVVTSSLAWSHDSRHWGIVAGDARSRRIFISLDGREQRALDIRDVVLLAEKRPLDDPDEAETALRAMVAAEVDSATQTPLSCPPQP